MPLTVNDLLDQFRRRIGDDATPQYYTDATLAGFFTDGASAYNVKAVQQVALSGSGTGTTITPATLSDPHLEIYLLYCQKAVYQGELSLNARRGFSISNVAGRIDGRERFLSSKGSMDMVLDLIKVAEERRDRGVVEGQMLVRDMSRGTFSGNALAELGV